MNFISENKEDFCCFSNFYKCNDFPFFDLTNRDEMCGYIDMEQIEKCITA